MKAIVAVDKNWGIGKNNGLLFKLPADMKYFREKTKGSVVCMGYNTLLSFPNGKPLEGRINITLCPEEIKRDDVICVHSLPELFAELKKYDKEIFVIGGAMFYRTMLNYCDEILVTKVSEDGCATVFFEDLDKNTEFDCIYESEEQETNGYKIKFTVYRNNAVTIY